MTSTPGARAPSAEALALFDLAACGLAQTRDDGTFVRVNRAFCGALGSEADALVGRRRFQDLLTMGGRIFHQTHWTPLLRMQGSISEVKLEFVHVDGTLVPMVVNAYRRDDGGAMVHEIAAYVARDRDKYERELLKARQRLEELVTDATRLHAAAKDRALFAEQMIGIVSHDLRNPISTIALAGEVLAQDPILAERRAVTSIARAADRATRLIQDLLDFTKVRLGGGLAFALVPLDLHAVVGEAIDDLRGTYPGRELRHVHGGEARCNADAGRVVQLVGNLVSNAVAYGSAGSAITVTTAAPSDATAALSVHNAGAAIPEAVREAVFEPMTRGADTGAARSVGLGLFIVREIARGHGGSVSVHSTDAEGTTFTVVLPRATSERADG